jgi:hypothetical protein
MGSPASRGTKSMATAFDSFAYNLSRFAAHFALWPRQQGHGSALDVADPVALWEPYERNTEKAACPSNPRATEDAARVC